MPYQISDPIDIPHLQKLLAALEADLRTRDEAAAALALRNAELHDKRQQRLAESERFGRVLVSLLQKTVLEQVLDIVCTEAQSLIGATGSAILMRTDETWLEVKHRLGQPLTTVDRLPVDGSLAGEVLRKGESVRLNDDVVDVGYSNDLAVVLNAAGKVYEYYPYEGGGHNLNSPDFEQAMQKNDPDDPSFPQTSTDGSAAP